LINLEGLMKLDDTFDYITDRKEIIKLLMKSQDYGLAIAITSERLGPGPCVISVDSILFEDEVTIVLKPYDANGRMLETSSVKLSEITSVVQLHSNFNNPFYKSTQFNAPHFRGDSCQTLAKQHHEN
jgi:hypothetical protein